MDLRPLCRIAALAVGLLSALPVPALARSRPLTLEEMARAGDRIVVGRVVGKTTRWGEGKKMIWTDYTVAVDEVWKGKAERSLVVSVAGGRVDGKAIEVTHVPHLAVGDTYVLCLYDNENLYGSPVVGSEQGAMREVAVAGEPAPVLVSTDDAVLSLTPQGRLASHDRLVRDAEGRSARRPEVSSGEGETMRGFARPVFRDGEGRVVTPTPQKKLRGIEGAPAPLTRAALREAVKLALAEKGEVAR